MSSFRIRLQCEAPSIKAWFLLAHLTTIAELKVALCTNISVLKNTGALARNLSLALDGFELLDESNVNILREGDLVCLQINQSDSRRNQIESSAKTTNIASVAASASHMGSAINSAARKLAGESSDEDSSSSSANSSSNSDTTSSSESDDSDDSSNSEAPSAAPIPRADVSNAAPRIATSTLHRYKAPTEHVPPGFGKPQTIKRNERRRRKRMHDRDRLDNHENIHTPQPEQLSSTNSLPLGPRSATKQSNTTSSGAKAPMPQVTAAPSFPMSSLSNKNKRRGYKEAPVVLPSKIIFGDETADTHGKSIPSPPDALSTPLPTPLPRLIAPSELQAEGAIPSSWNLFVTSVDVEERMSHRNRKRRKRAINEDPVSYSNVVDELEDSEVVEQLEYPMSDQDMSILPDVAPLSSDMVPWDDIDRRFDQLPLFKTLDNVQVGMQFAWKALDINPVTFTPEILLHVAECSKLSEGTITVKNIQQPGARPLAFGQHDDNNDGVEDDLMNVIEDTVTLEEAQLSGWRIVI